MISPTSSNRKVIEDYLQSVKEDTFISDVIIPFYNSLGYSNIQTPNHGPGEHGKDIVFKKYKPAINSDEYLVVQAKAEKVTAGNVVKMSEQLIRALRTPIIGLCGGVQVFPNYVVFFNARGKSNDALFEFPSLIDGNNNIKEINKESVCELIMKYDSAIPASIKDELEIRDSKNSWIDNKVQATIYSNKTTEINELFENTIKLNLTSNLLFSESKRLIIEYIFKLWEEDPSFSGLVKPMKWLDMCFDFIQPEQYIYLKKVVSEFYNTTPSYAAKSFTISIIKKINNEQICAIEKVILFHLLYKIDFNKNDDILMSKYILVVNNLDGIIPEIQLMRKSFKDLLKMRDSGRKLLNAINDKKEQVETQDDEELNKLKENLTTLTHEFNKLKRSLTNDCWES